jgi:AcrR family transcriptional regulator
MAEIARRSGVGPATLYRNFATRHELLEALLADEVEEVDEVFKTRGRMLAAGQPLLAAAQDAGLDRRGT